MAEAAKIRVEPRDSQKNKGTGTRVARRLRKGGLIPAVIYGHKQAVVPVPLTRDDVWRMVKSPGHLAELDLGRTSGGGRAGRSGGRRGARSARGHQARPQGKREGRLIRIVVRIAPRRSWPAGTGPGPARDASGDGSNRVGSRDVGDNEAGGRSG